MWMFLFRPWQRHPLGPPWADKSSKAAERAESEGAHTLHDLGLQRISPVRDPSVTLNRVDLAIGTLVFVSGRFSVS